MQNLLFKILFAIVMAAASLTKAFTSRTSIQILINSVLRRYYKIFVFSINLRKRWKFFFSVNRMRNNTPLIRIFIDKVRNMDIT